MPTEKRLAYLQFKIGIKGYFRVILSIKHLPNRYAKTHINFAGLFLQNKKTLKRHQRFFLGLQIFLYK